MKALIYNSGFGSRMGELTKDKPKCMVELYNGETILERQIRILSECGIKEFIITTGPYEELLKEAASHVDAAAQITFVPNPEYKTTNYIVSMNYAYDYLDDDMLLLHGDLVFNKGLVEKVLADERPSLCLYNEEKKLPEKDFKGRFKDGLLREVSVNIFDDDCYAFQPLYKLSKDDLTKWKDKAREFVEGGNCKVYAENALNEIADSMTIFGMSYKDDYIDEIDNEEDYKRVFEEIKYYDFREQRVEYSDDYISSLKKYAGNKKLFMVCGKALKGKISKELSEADYDIVICDSYSSNPKYEDIQKGIELFNNSGCDIIVSVGGGSTIDVAKCIKAAVRKVEHIAIPTTAGTGSESTCIAVYYKDGEKQSLEMGTILPEVAILDKKLLDTLPDYHMKSSLLDSLCQAIESFWALKATPQSREYASRCMELIINNYETYLNHEGARGEMLEAANLSGKAINLSRTTAPHAMSYKLTSIYNISHGHAVALCLIPCWKLLHEKSRTDDSLYQTLTNLAKHLGKDSIEESIKYIEEMILKMNLPKVNIKEDDLELLTASVNIQRLSNNPVLFETNEIYELYKILMK